MCNWSQPHCLLHSSPLMLLHINRQVAPDKNRFVRHVFWPRAKAKVSQTSTLKGGVKSQPSLRGPRWWNEGVAAQTASPGGLSECCTRLDTWETTETAKSVKFNTITSARLANRRVRQVWLSLFRKVKKYLDRQTRRQKGECDVIFDTTAWKHTDQGVEHQGVVGVLLWGLHHDVEQGIESVLEKLHRTETRYQSGRDKVAMPTRKHSSIFHIIT